MSKLIAERSTASAVLSSPSRRSLFGAGASILTGVALITGGAAAAASPDFLKPPPLPWRNGPRPPDGADAELLQLCADLQGWDRQRQQVDRVSADGRDFTDEELSAVLDPWWNTVDAIAETPARTPEGVMAKGRALRTAFVGTYGDKSPRVISLLASLLTDMLGEPVRLPGAEGDDA